MLSPFTIFAEKLGLMLNALLGLAAFVAVALIGWAIAELKGKTCNYEQNEDEKFAKWGLDILPHNWLTLSTKTDLRRWTSMMSSATSAPKASTLSKS